METTVYKMLTSINYELAQIPTIENYLPIDENKKELWIPIIAKESK